MVNWNIYKDNIMTSGVSHLNSSRSSQHFANSQSVFPASRKSLHITVNTLLSVTYC